MIKILWSIIRILIAILGGILAMIWMCPFGLLFFFLMIVTVPVRDALGDTDKVDGIMLTLAIWPMALAKFIIEKVDRNINFNRN